MWRPDGDLRAIHRRRGAIPLSPDRQPGTTMTCSFSSRNSPARERQPVRTARLIAPSHRRASRHLPTRLSALQAEPLSAYLILSHDQKRNSKRITPQCQTAHFKSLYRKRSGIKIRLFLEAHFAGAFPNCRYSGLHEPTVKTPKMGSFRQKASAASPAPWPPAPALPYDGCRL